METETNVTSESLAVSVNEAIKLVGISRTKFYQMVKEGQGPTVKAVGRRRLILREDLEAWLRSLDAAA